VTFCVVLDRVRIPAETRMDRAFRKVDDQEVVSSESDRARSARQISIEMVHAESQELLRLRDEEGLPDVVMRKLQNELDLRLETLRTLN
jgi:hypothetical protein